MGKHPILALVFDFLQEHHRHLEFVVENAHIPLLQDFPRDEEDGRV